jgi:hypothetical protein
MKEKGGEEGVVRERKADKRERKGICRKKA